MGKQIRKQNRIQADIIPYIIGNEWENKSKPFMRRCISFTI